MRLSVPAVILAVALGGACSSQPLAPVMLGGGPRSTGTGGQGVMSNGGGGQTVSPTGIGGGSGWANGAGTGTGASGSGSGGTGLMGAPDYSNVDGGYAACQALVMQYEGAIAEAQQCDVTGAGGCQQVVLAHLGTCDSCPTYVNDTTKPLAIQAQWQAAGCDQAAPGQACGNVCQAPTNYACVDIGNGTGKCGTGIGLSPCGSLQVQYATALAAAKSCTAGATGQCTEAVPSDLSPCSRHCATYVNDASALNPIKDAWDSQGCGIITVICPQVDCTSELSGACVAGDAGGASCVGDYTMSRPTL